MSLFKNVEKSIIILHLNARIQPIQRIEDYEDGIDEVLKTYKIGEVIGGGTLLSRDGEPESCDIEIMIANNKIDSFIRFIKQISIPRGSYLEVGKDKVEIGELEGLAIYIDKSNIYKEINELGGINYFIEKLDKLLNEHYEIYSSWEGEVEIALYFYGKSFNEMKHIISTYLQGEEYKIIQIC